jgi:hypothetical protein
MSLTDWSTSCRELLSKTLQLAAEPLTDHAVRSDDGAADHLPWNKAA